MLSFHPEVIEELTEIPGLFENRTTEFKMHTAMSIEDLSQSAETHQGDKVIRRYQPISKTICAFLNSSGGRIFLGIDDTGIVRGLVQSPLQLEHFLLNLDDTLQRFEPKVAHDAVKMEIVRVIPHDRENKKDLSIFDYKESKTLAVHTFRGSCLSCKNSCVMGVQLYIIVLNVTKSPGPIYTNEEGLAYERSWAGNRMLSAEMLRQRLCARFNPKSTVQQKLNSLFRFSPLKSFEQPLFKRVFAQHGEGCSCNSCA